jgi:mannose-1-phosphate guanylyltransferase
MKILIMAGGGGERFWPLSTKDRPKQLLHLVTGKTMIRETINRVVQLVDINDIYVATNTIQADNIRTELDELPFNNLIIEPAFKDTAAAIAFGSLIIQRNSKSDPTIAVLASDHIIHDVKSFQEMLILASLEANKGFIVTLGVKPIRPETGYGYIELSSNQIGLPTPAIKFMEKPDLTTAINYIKSGNYFWNSGMFIFKHTIMMQELKKYLPNHYSLIQEMKDKIHDFNGLDLTNHAEPFFKRFEKISIDFGIMEKSTIIKCIPTDFGWNDVGGFNSLEEVFDKDEYGNIIKDVKYFYIDSKNNIVISSNKDKTVATIGVSNKIIVDTSHSLLICDKKDSQRIKEILKLIN